VTGSAAQQGGGQQRRGSRRERCSQVSQVPLRAAVRPRRLQCACGRGGLGRRCAAAAVALVTLWRGGASVEACMWRKAGLHAVASTPCPSAVAACWALTVTVRHEHQQQAQHDSPGARGGGGGQTDSSECRTVGRAVTARCSCNEQLFGRRATHASCRLLRCARALTCMHMHKGRTHTRARTFFTRERERACTGGDQDAGVQSHNRECTHACATHRTSRARMLVALARAVHADACAHNSSARVPPMPL
jgi:hypothetical protein